MKAENRAAIVDEFGALDAELTSMKGKKDRHEQLRKLILSWCETYSPAQAAAVEGHGYVVTISERAMERFFKTGAMKRLAAFIGAAFWNLCKVSLKDFDDYVAAPERSRFVEESQSGRRTVKVIAKSQVKAA